MRLILNVENWKVLKALGKDVNMATLTDDEIQNLNKTKPFEIKFKLTEDLLWDTTVFDIDNNYLAIKINTYCIDDVNATIKELLQDREMYIIYNSDIICNIDKVGLITYNINDGGNNPIPVEARFNKLELQLIRKKYLEYKFKAS